MFLLNRIAFVFCGLLASFSMLWESNTIAAEVSKLSSGSIAYSQPGYVINHSKVAFAQNLPGKEWKLVKLADPKTKKPEKVLLTKEFKLINKGSNTFQALDFSEVMEPGFYELRIDKIKSNRFQIDHGVWFGLLPTALEQFRNARCSIPLGEGKPLCHEPVTVKDGETQLQVQGGWHSTESDTLLLHARTVYALLSAGSRVAEDIALQTELSKEATWGVQWLVGTRFPNGKRIHQISRSQTGQDPVIHVAEEPLALLWAAAAQARVAALSKETNAAFLQESIRTAALDFGHAISNLNGNLNIEIASVAALAAAELFTATGEQDFASKGASFAEYVVHCQQRPKKAEAGGAFGFFYSTTNKLERFKPGANSSLPIVAMIKMCETFPRHFQWIQWHSAIAIHSEHLKSGITAKDSFYLLPSAFRTENEASFGNDRVWTALALAKSLGIAARCIHDPVSAELAHQHLQWLSGRNQELTNHLEWKKESTPSPLPAATSGSSLAKAAQLIWALGDVAIQPSVSGVVEPGGEVEFLDLVTGNRFRSTASKDSGRFLTRMPPGQYQAKFHQKTIDLYLGAGSQHELNFTNYLSFTLVREKKDSKPILRVRADGEGKHSFTLVASNLKFTSPIHTLTFQLDISDTTLWPIEVANPNEPVVAVVFADDQPANRRELFFWP